jgi:hypothetical protein
MSIAHILIAALSAATSSAPTPKGPAEAIEIADRATSNGVKGRYEMVVAATGKNGKATFLNSLPDYRSPGNVTFSLSPPAAVSLKKRYGEPPERYLLGKRIVVDGIVLKTPIANLFSGRPRSFNRFSYTVQIQRVAQIVSID